MRPPKEAMPWPERVLLPAWESVVADKRPGAQSGLSHEGRKDELPDLAGRLALRPREAAEALGISERTLRALLPELPHVRAGGVVLLPVDGLRRWLEERAKAGEERASAVAREILEVMQGSK